jgi:hypothetical protein
MDTLELLEAELAKDLLARVRSGAATAAELAVARQYLKDAGAFAGVIESGTPAHNLLDNLPFTEAPH